MSERYRTPLLPLLDAMPGWELGARHALDVIRHREATKALKAKRR